MTPSSRMRHGFTVMECMIALAVLSGAAALVAEMVTRSLVDRSRLDARAEAVDAVTNALERARARPWEELTPQWAKAQVPPESLARWSEARLTVVVEPEPNRPRVKRVTAEVTWDRPQAHAWPPVTLTTLIAARTVEGNP